MPSVARRRQAVATLQVVRKLWLPVILALAAATGVGSANAATGVVVRGAGYGHGVGLSQYGAYGFAKQGREYEEILAHYYRDTELSRTDDQPVRVLLRDQAPSIVLRGALRAGTSALSGRRLYTARPVGTSRVELRDRRGRRIGRFPTPLAVSGADRNLQLVGCAPINGIQDGHYRGTLEIRRSEGGGLTVVNELPVDEYLQGVIPGEVPPSWPAEALKAQAVAARSYALATNVADEVFDQYPDTRSQVYQGADAERPSTNAAARKTGLQVLRSDGKVIVANFFSTSGGKTENVENGFAGAESRPYLKSVEDPFDDISPLHDWRLGYSTSDMQERLDEFVKGKFRRIEVKERGVSPRIISAEIVGSKGRTEVSGAELKAELDLYDTWAFFRNVRGRGLPDGPPEAPEGGSGCLRLERVSLGDRPQPKPKRQRGTARPAPSPESPAPALGASLGVIARG